jgi:hypothetical protein
MAAGLLGSMDLQTAMEQTPHRMYLAMVAWLDEQWNQPGRSDWYAMQIAQMVRNKNSKNPIGLSEFKIPFEFPQPPTEEEIAEKQKQMLEAQKRKWFGIAGYRGKP